VFFAPQWAYCCYVRTCGGRTGGGGSITCAWPVKTWRGRQVTQHAADVQRVALCVVSGRGTMECGVLPSFLASLYPSSIPRGEEFLYTPAMRQRHRVLTDGACSIAATFAAAGRQWRLVDAFSILRLLRTQRHGCRGLSSLPANYTFSLPACLANVDGTAPPSACVFF